MDTDELANKQPTVVLPGDRVPGADELHREKRKIVVGPGLAIAEGKIHATRAGLLRFQKPGIFYVDSFMKRYTAVRGESVVGTVVAKVGDYFRVDIGASEPASLSYLAFEGATKKNRPDVSIGDTIFAKILIANRDLEPELVCVDSHGKKERLGVLHDGFVFTCSINLIRKILKAECPLLKTLSKEVAFEIAIGMNARIWIRAKTVKETIAVGNALLAAENLTNAEIVKMCDKIGQILGGFT